MTREEMDAVVGEHFRAEAVHDVGAIVATLNEDAEHDVVGMPEPLIVGRERIAERYAAQFVQMAGEQVQHLRRYYGEDFMVDESLITGRVPGVFMGIAGENRKVSFRLLHVLEFRDGLISRENVWLDTGAILAQLGALPANPSASGVEGEPSR